MSPFHDLGRRCGGPFPAESARSLPSSAHTSAVGGRPGANAELQGISLPRLAGLLSLGVLGLVGLLSLGVGGVVLVQGYVFPASEVGTRELMGPSRHGRDIVLALRMPAADPATSARATAARSLC